MESSNKFGGGSVEFVNNGVSNAADFSHQFEVEKNYFDSFRSGFSFGQRQAHSLGNFMPNFNA